MGTVTFGYTHARDTDNVLELEIEATIIKAFNSTKLVSVDSIEVDGERLTASQIEDLVEEIGEDTLAEYAAEHGCDEEDEDDPVMDEEDFRLMEELNH